MGRLSRDLVVQDAVVPRSALPDVLETIGRIAATYQLTVSNVFHAGDGNLHPNISFDGAVPGLKARVDAASTEIMEACIAVGGTITGEHGVGLDKLRYMPLIFDGDSLAAMRAVRRVWDPGAGARARAPPPAPPPPSPSPRAGWTASPRSGRRPSPPPPRRALGATCCANSSPTAAPGSRSTPPVSPAGRSAPS